jgi:hypothetical protein
MSRLVEYNAIVRFDYEKQTESEVSLKVGEIVKVVEEFDSGWWVGQVRYNEKTMLLCIIVVVVVVGVVFVFVCD